MYTTMDDYGKFLMMYLKEGMCGDTMVHPPETLTRMQTSQIATGNPIVGGFGQGWWVDLNAPDTWVTVPGAFGSTPYIDHERGIAVFTAMESAIDPIGLDLLLRLRSTIEPVVDEIIAPGQD